MADELVVLFCFLTSMAAGVDAPYWGVPGKWKKGAKVAKGQDKTAGSAAPAEAAPKERGKRTMIIRAPAVTVTPGSDSSKKRCGVSQSPGRPSDTQHYLAPRLDRRIFP